MGCTGIIARDEEKFVQMIEGCDDTQGITDK